MASTTKVEALGSLQRMPGFAYGAKSDFQPGKGENGKGTFATGAVQGACTMGEMSMIEWKITSLKATGGLAFGVIDMQDSEAAEDWGSQSKAGKVWYMLVRGSQATENLSLVSHDVMFSKCPPAKVGDRVRLQWTGEAVDFWLNKNYVGSLELPNKPQTAYRFALQIWRASDHVKLIEAEGLGELPRSKVTGLLATPSRTPHSRPVSAVVRSSARTPSSAVRSSGTPRSMVRFFGDTKSVGHSHQRAASTPGVPGTPGTPGTPGISGKDELRRFRWQCNFQCNCQLQASWSKRLGQPRDPRLCGCADCRDTSMFQNLASRSWKEIHEECLKLGIKIPGHRSDQNRCQKGQPSSNCATVSYLGKTYKFNRSLLKLNAKSEGEEIAEDLQILHEIMVKQLGED